MAGLERVSNGHCTVEFASKEEASSKRKRRHSRYVESGHYAGYSNNFAGHKCFVRQVGVNSWRLIRI